MPVPEEIRGIYEEVKSEATWIHARWIIYRQLFLESDRRIALLNECASACFYVLQDLLLGDVQISLSKLTDPAENGSHANLSLEQLQRGVELHGNNELAGRLRVLLDTLHIECAPFRRWRNKRLAHLDLETALAPTLNPLPDISRDMIEGALSTVRTYLNEIEGHYEDSEVAYEHFFMTASDGDALVELLKGGLRYGELVTSDEIPHDDYLESEWHDA